MSKYTTQFKLSAITAFLERGRGFRHIAAQFQMDPTLLRRWVKAYQIHGEASFERTGVEPSPEFKLAVLHRMWREQLSLRATAALFNLSDSSKVRRWQQQYYSGGVEALSSTKRSPSSMSKSPTPDEPSSRANEELSLAELLVKVRKLELENAWLKKLEALDEEKMRLQKPRKKKPG
ncbi:transposase [Pseudomonas cichorii]|nr:helix-turn-helix domain-containing protein [Pseudomonas cichorii]GFM53817.1 transposase [Pseudomonas cichorii]